MAATFSSFKWITSEDSVLRAHDVRRVLQPVWSHPTNLVSIFGRARQGKSFLMNCLAGEKEIFRISNEKESCTQGIDVSNKFMSVRQFATVDGGRLDSRGHEVDSIRVGFVDAEGQGDKDVSYDANLICPILLASKSVIFNWKGDMQKDAILNTLGIMCRAAQNVGVEAGSSHKFGHLHIVFRDWQAEGSTAEDTFQHIFRQESSSEASTRNKIRRDLKEAFTSIRVWLLDAPTELVSDLKKKLTIDKTSALFRSQIRDLRSALANELITPCRFGDSILTGKVLHSAMSVMADTLNQGEVVLPGAAYRAMLAEELRASRDHYQREVQAKVEELLAVLRKKAKLASANSNEDAGDFMSGEEAGWLFDEEIGAIGTKYESSIEGILETTPGDRSYDGLRKQEKEAIKLFQQQMSEYYFAQWTNEVNKWVLPTRQVAEKRLQRLIADVSKKMSALILDGEKSNKESNQGISSEMLLTAVIQEVWVKVSACFGSKQPCFQENPIFVDAVQTVQNHFDTAKAQLWLEFKEAYAQIVRTNIEALAQEAGDEMLHQIEVLPRKLYTKLHTLGFPIDIYMMALNQEFHRLKARIEQEVRQTLLPTGNASAVSEKIVQETSAEVIAALETQIAASLKGAAIQQYKSFREEIFASIMKRAGEDFLPMLHRLAEGWESREPNLDEINPDVPYYGPTYHDITKDISHSKTMCERDMLSLLCGWLCDNAQEYATLATSVPNQPAVKIDVNVQQQKVRSIMQVFEQQSSGAVPSGSTNLAIKFLVQLDEYLKSIIAPFQQEARAIIQAMEEEYEIKQSSLLEEREAAAYAAHAAAEAAAAAAAQYDAYEEEELPVATKKKQARRSSGGESDSGSGVAAGKSTTVDEQRRRAAEWAAKNLKTVAKKSKATTATAVSAAATAVTTAETKKRSAGSRFSELKPTKTVEQQRRDALEYAHRVFGDAVLEPDNDDEDDVDNDKPKHRRTSKTRTVTSPVAVPVTSARGKSAIEAAKEAARELQEQRLRNQANDAAARAQVAADKKKRARP